MGEDSPSKAKVLVAAVTDWKADDDHTVVATLDQPNAELPVILATFHFKIVKDGTEDFQNPVGTGPYKLAEFKPGVRSVSRQVRWLLGRWRALRRPDRSLWHHR